MKKKSVTNTAKLILEIWNIGLFAAVWIGFYNYRAFDSFGTAGAIGTIIFYYICYNFLCNTYKAFRFASSSVGEIIFFHFISFGITDLLTFIEACLVRNDYINILPGVCTVAVQLAGTCVIVIQTKHYFMNHIAPQKTVLIYGKDVKRTDAEAFCRRILKKYEHLFHIEHVCCEEEELSALKQKILASDTILFYELSSALRVELLNLCLQGKKNAYFTPTLDDIMLQGCVPKHLLDTPLMKYDYAYEKGYATKRLWDIVMAIIFLILTSPILLLTALAIKIEDRGPVFYKQKRCTKDAKVFEILKFRSMIVDAEKDGVIPCAVNDNRITKVGKVIRATRIDELPQLLNILKGDMSFVGPRPERVEHVEQYCKEVPEFAYRMRVKGGLTGYAQIYGKYNTSAYDKLRLDMMYIEKQSIILDLKILVLTFRTIFQLESTEGFTEENSQQMNEKTKEKRLSKVIYNESE